MAEARDGSHVDQQTAIERWSEAAHPVLILVAKQYRATVTYKELAAQVQDATGVTTSQLFRYWIGKVLFSVGLACGRRAEPLLTALCVRADGTVGEGYAVAVRDRYGIEPADLEQHAAAERLACYRYFGASLPPDGGTPALTPQVAAKRQAPRRSKPPERGRCPTCQMRLPANGACHLCD